MCNLPCRNFLSHRLSLAIIRLWLGLVVIGCITSPAAAMQIFVKNLTDQVTTLEVESNDTVENIKAKYEDQTAVPANRQIMVFGNKILQDNYTLADYNIQKQSTVNVLPAVNPAGILHVNANSTAALKDGYSWNTALSHLDDALAIAKAENALTSATVKQIWISRDIYTPTRPAAARDLQGNPTTARDFAFVLVDGVDILGGFSGTETTPEQRPQPMIATTLSAPTGPFSTTSPYHVIICAANLQPITLNGIAIRWGLAEVVSSDPRIVVNGENIGNNGGGGIYASKAKINLETVAFIGNGGFGGGGLFALDSEVTATGLVFDGNRAIFGGAAFADNCQFNLTNFVLAHNTGQEGTALTINDSTGYLTNATVTANYGLYNPAPIAVRVENSNVNIRNSLFLGNEGVDVDWVFQGQVAVTYSHTYANGVYYKPNGNVAATLTPADVFINPGTPENPSVVDYHLKPGTLAVNGGDSSLYSPGQTPDLSAVTRDLDGHLRIQGTNIDLGAFEGHNSTVELWELY